MKNKKTCKVILLLLISLLLATLVSCGGSEGTEGDSEGENGNTGQGEGGETANPISLLVYSSDIAEGGVSALQIVDAFEQSTGVRIKGKSDSLATEEDGVLSVGSTSRAIAAEAAERMNAELSASGAAWDLASYIVYSNGKSVAVYWNDPLVADVAMKDFMALLESGELFEDLLARIGSVSRIEIMEKAEAQQRKSSLEAVASSLGEGAADAVADHLALATDAFYLWLADLYLPRSCVCENYGSEGERICLHPKDANGEFLCTGGGFYYSNSARDNDGFEIDIESTAQALSFIARCGMLGDDEEEDISAVLSAQMKADLVAFAKSLQSSEDGYFYHPQWGKNIGTSRLGRDLRWATQVITDLGAKPYYDAPNGTEGELGAPGQTSALTSPLTQSTAIAVAKLQLCATVWPDHLKTVEAFESYLDGLDLANKSWTVGNNMSSQSAQIKNRDAEGMKNGEFTDSDGDGIAEDGLVAAFKRHFDAAQNSENGLWENEVHYSSVNGLMKICSSYNSLGLVIPHPLEAFDSAVSMAVLSADSEDVEGGTANGSVDVYNPWVAISHLLSNIRRYGDPAVSTALKHELSENAEQMIRVTTEKTLKFAKDDGSYGYTWNYSPANSQGAPVAVPNTVEGDVNGGTIAIRGIWNEMSLVLGVSIPIYYPSDLMKFLHRIDEIYTAAN